MSILNRILKRPEERAKEHYLHGRAFMEQERWNEAEQELAAALEIRPVYRAAWYALGFVHRKQGNLHGAIADYLTVLEIDPECEKAKQNLALIFRQEGQLPVAIQAVKRARELGVNSAGELLKELQALRDSELAQRPRVLDANIKARTNLSERIPQQKTRPTLKTTVPQKMTGEDVVKSYKEGKRDFREETLTRIDLSHANLRGADFSGADLSLANLGGADLTGARLTSARLYGAYLQNAVLRGAKLNGSRLQRADLRWANLDLAQLRGANLSGSKLFKARVTDYQLSQAVSLAGAVLPNGRRHR